MPWLRGGDNAATHPIVMRVFSVVRTCVDQVLERDVAVNEVFGFVCRCAFEAAGHTTDYVIEEGTAYMLGGARTDRLVELAIKAGYWKRQRRGSVTTYRLVDDPQFLHMRLKAEIEREQQRKADNGNDALTGPVRLRDGDECRYCGKVVNWDDRRGGRGGTYDARGGHPSTIDTLVVACRRCNAARGAAERDSRDPDTVRQLQPPPIDPYYSPGSAEFLTERGHPVQPTENQRPGSQPDTAPATRQPAGHRASDPTTGNAPVATPATANRAHAPPRPAETADQKTAGSGLLGTGRAGTGGAVHPTPAQSAAPARARPRRSPRSRTRQPTRDI